MATTSMCLLDHQGDVAGVENIDVFLSKAWCRSDRSETHGVAALACMDI